MPDMKALKKARVDSSRAMDSSSAGWAESHAQLMERKGLEWWATSIPAADVVEQWPCLKLLTYRQFDILRMVNMGFPDPARRQADVSQGASRARAASGTPRRS